MKTIKINIAFKCKNCGHQNSPVEKSCRNHCTNCLYSLHVDQETPGDRASECQNLMEPIRIESSGKKGYMIIHKCLKCGKIIPNKAASDDSTDKLIEIMQKQNLNY
ncbi:RNHCP domain-containing protein [Candidatus Peregrinibacteria bacterium]|nr:RNHCP domain-containing protein [Candidatus Peregrinibacteria bacterium]